MKVLTEMELRAKWKTLEDGVYHVEAGTFVTPMAKDFLRGKGCPWSLTRRRRSP